MSNTVTNFNIDAIRNIASALAFDGSQSLLVSLTQETIDAIRTKLGASSTIAVGQVPLNGISDTLVVPIRATRTKVILSNTSPDIGVYVGPENVTSLDGFFIPPYQMTVVETSAALYGIAASGTPSLSFLEAYN